MRIDIVNTGTGKSDSHHIKDILIATAGDFKFSPAVGFAIVKYMKSNASEARFRRNLNQQLDYDGYGNAEIDISRGMEKLTIEV